MAAAEARENVTPDSPPAWVQKIATARLAAAEACENVTPDSPPAWAQKIAAARDEL